MQAMNYLLQLYIVLKSMLLIIFVQQVARIAILKI
jgi:hypothetical protein